MKSAALILLGACALSAQTPAPAAGNPLLGEMKQSYTQIKNNLTRMAEKMPAEDYSFKPVDSIRSFGELMTHIADANTFFCSVANGAAKRPDNASKKTKDEIVAALKDAFSECDKAFDGTTEANAAQSVSMGGRGQMSRLGVLTRNLIHDNEEYGYGAIYLRLKNVVPPSSDNAGRGGR